MTKIICPKCGSRRIAKNRWGKHIFTEKLFDAVEKGRIRIKKGKKKEGSFEYWCHQCQKDFGRSTPRYYSDAISRFCLSIGDVANGRTTVEIYPVDKVIMAVMDQSAQDVIIPNRPALWISDKFWHTFTKKLLQDNLLLEWSRRYDGPDVPDGKQWSLDVDFSLSRHIRWVGTNRYPPYWDTMLRQLMKLLKKSLSGADIDKVTRVWLEQCLSYIGTCVSPKDPTEVSDEADGLVEGGSQP